MRSDGFNSLTTRRALLASSFATLAVALTTGALSTGMAEAAGIAAEDDTLETFRLADRSNLRRLDNGDFLFRLARDRRTGIVYWAYMGSTRHVIAVAPDWNAFADNTVARAALLRIADLPRRVGKDTGFADVLPQQRHRRLAKDRQKFSRNVRRRPWRCRSGFNQGVSVGLDSVLYYGVQRHI